MNKQIELPPGSVVVAVSGGVDSMVLLDLVRQQKPNDEMLAAHFKHNVRAADETEKDLVVIEGYCRRHHIRLEVGEYRGGKRDEAGLRAARYDFLNKLKASINYNAIITAHHSDDVIETAIFNLLRGTGGAGLTSLASDDALVRPLLDWSKADIITYANEHKLRWHEDVTNADERYARNYIRNRIIPQLQAKGSYDRFEAHVFAQQSKQRRLDEALDVVGEQILATKRIGHVSVRRNDFIRLPHSVARALFWYVFRTYFAGVEPSRSNIEKMVIFAKTSRHGAGMDVAKNVELTVGAEFVEFFRRA